MVKAGCWDGGCSVQERYDREVGGEEDTRIEGKRAAINSEVGWTEEEEGEEDDER